MSRVREILFGVVRLSGLPRLLREFVQRRYVTILVYHRPDPTTVDRHFEALLRIYRPIDLRAYLLARRQRTVGQLPPKSVIVTFDDGHESIYRLKPVLHRHGVPVTVFLCSGLVGTKRGFWFLACGLDDALRQRLKKVPDDERLTVLREIGFDETAEHATGESLSSNEVEDLNTVVDFQSHTVSHPILPACSEQKASVEIARSRDELEKRLGRTVNAIAYPNGSYTEREMRMAQQAGYECGLTMDPGFNGPEIPMFALRRIAIPDDCGVHEFIVRSSGLWAFLHAARQALHQALWSSRSANAQPRHPGLTPSVD